MYELERIYDNHKDPSSRSYKLLGALFDENLTFNYHIDYLKSKLSKALFCINRVKKFVPQETQKLFTFPFYIPISCTVPKNNIETFFIMQKKAVRSITNSKYPDHPEPIFSSLTNLP